MKRTLAVVAAALCAWAVQAEPYWVSFDASTGRFPEQDGWTRTTYGGGAQRWFEDGALVLDGLASMDISDFYRMGLATLPGAGEVFRMEWRLRVDQVQGFADPWLSINAAGHGTVALRYTEDAVYSLHEGAWIPFTPGVFHDFTFTSTDMLTYSLLVDGQLGRTGYFVGPWPESYVCWGDGTRGASSLSLWDSVDFGNVPEPSASLILGSAALAVTVLRTGRA